MLAVGAFGFETVMYIGAFGLLAIGAAGLVMSSNLFRMVLALVIAEAGANLVLVLSGWRDGAVAPILGVHQVGAPMVDPIPQVLVLTAIVIGVGVQALAVSALLKIHRIYGTLDVRELRRHLELDICRHAGMAPEGSREAPAGGRPLPPPISPPRSPPRSPQAPAHAAASIAAADQPGARR
jgi:multisubunit Na+/H+ antiporter MnhC subunit